MFACWIPIVRLFECWIVIGLVHCKDGVMVIFVNCLKNTRQMLSTVTTAKPFIQRLKPKPVTFFAYTAIQELQMQSYKPVKLWKSAACVCLSVLSHVHFQASRYLCWHEIQSIRVSQGKTFPFEQKLKGQSQHLRSCRGWTSHDQTHIRVILNQSTPSPDLPLTHTTGDPFPHKFTSQIQGRQQIVRERFKDYVLWEGKTEEWFARTVKLMMPPGGESDTICWVTCVSGKCYFEAMAHIFTKGPQRNIMWNRRPAVQSLSAELTPISSRSILTLGGVMVMAESTAKRGAMEKENSTSRSSCTCVLRNVWRQIPEGLRNHHLSQFLKG